MILSKIYKTISIFASMALSLNFCNNTEKISFRNPFENVFAEIEFSSLEINKEEISNYFTNGRNSFYDKYDCSFDTNYFFHKIENEIKFISFVQFQSNLEIFIDDISFSLEYDKNTNFDRSKFLYLNDNYFIIDPDFIYVFDKYGLNIQAIDYSYIFTDKNWIYDFGIYSYLNNMFIYYINYENYQTSFKTLHILSVDGLDKNIVELDCYSYVGNDKIKRSIFSTNCYFESFVINDDLGKFLLLQNGYVQLFDNEKKYKESDCIDLSGDRLIQISDEKIIIDNNLIDISKNNLNKYCINLTKSIFCLTSNKIFIFLQTTYEFTSGLYHLKKDYIPQLFIFEYSNGTLKYTMPQFSSLCLGTYGKNKDNLYIAISSLPDIGNFPLQFKDDLITSYFKNAYYLFYI